MHTQGQVLAVMAVVVVVVVSGQAYDTPKCDGQTIVQLFEWKWNDIAKECEQFLGPVGFCGVQVSPPNEHVLAEEAQYPWWQRYQPVSYKLESRSGTILEFIDMTQKCNAAGVRIIVDAVVNHMAELGRFGTGSGGSPYNADNRDFPAVPFSDPDFTLSDLCPSPDGQVNNYQDPAEVRNCYLAGLTDLFGARQYVRQKIADYFNTLISIGVMGFRVDAAKYMWPKDLEAIQELTNDLSTEAGFPKGARPFFYHEVIEVDGQPIRADEYFDLGRTTEFKYGRLLKLAIDNFVQLQDLYNSGWDLVPPEKAVVFVDNHKTQRGLGGPGDVLTHVTPVAYTMGVAFTLAQPYGFARIMSSYSFSDTDQGPPGSSNDGATDSITINSDGSCGGGWVCEHRWNAIKKMVAFRNTVAGTSITNWYLQGDNVAFSRGDKGFFAMSKSGYLDVTLQTGLPAGTYCELISGCNNMVTVNSDGTAQVTINNSQEPIFAICEGCGVGGLTPIRVVPVTPTTEAPPDAPLTDGARTVIFLRKQTSPGQDLFLRGAIDPQQRPGCNTGNADTDPCAIDITVYSLGSEAYYDKYNAWRRRDTKLDWYGAQPDQGTYQDQPASGTPMALTTNIQGADGYQELNTFGEDYWMVDVAMNCSQTEGGWFEVKGYLPNGGGWEADVTQVPSCSGDVGGATPYTSNHHLARCGFLNVFEFGASSCIINSLPGPLPLRCCEAANTTLPTEAPDTAQKRGAFNTTLPTEAPDTAPKRGAFNTTLPTEAPDTAPKRDAFNTTLPTEAPDTAQKRDAFNTTLPTEAPDTAPKRDAFNTTLPTEAPDTAPPTPLP